MKNYIILGLVYFWTAIEDVTVDGVLTWRTAAAFLLMLVYVVYDSVHNISKKEVKK